MISAYTIIFTLLTGYFLGLNPVSSYTQFPPEMHEVECDVSNKVFMAGEEITYNLYYHLVPFWIKAGEVTFTIEDRDSCFHVIAIGETASSFEWFYKVRDVYTCDIDKQTLKPIRSTRDIREGSYTKISIAEYDFDTQQVYAKSGKTRDKMKDIIMPMDNCMHDILSVIYYTRNLDFNSIDPGSIVPTNIFLDDEKYNIGFIYDGVEENKKIKRQGRTSTHVLRPQLIAGYVFEDNTEMMIYASNDRNRLPLLIESPVSVGSIKAVLSDYKNLRHEIDFD